MNKQRNIVAKYAAFMAAVLFAVILSGFVSSIKFQPDTSFAGIKLHDCNSVQDALGDIKQYHTDDSIAPFKGHIFIDDSLSQYIRLVHYPGDFICQFSRIEIGNLKLLTKEKFTQYKRFKNFTTESGVSIGMRIDKLTSIKGAPISVSKQGELLIYTYKLDSNSLFVKRFNEAEYTALFYFENNTLVKYDFGFEYP